MKSHAIVATTTPAGFHRSAPRRPLPRSGGEEGGGNPCGRRLGVVEKWSRSVAVADHYHEAG